ncbi:hypothetical protein B0H11DRAFT_2264688 [Mycena galericulata]|nr:hypothetical protein B0H11DRAFT_2264688 [Mycena galericulata]
MDTPMPAFFKFDNTLGALLAGGLVAAALWGVTCVQTYIFFMSETTDRTWHKALVAFLVILDTFDTVLTCHILYFYLVSNYLAPQALEFPVCSAVLDVAVTAFSNFIVRGAYARRVYGLSKGNILGTLWILLLSLFDLCEEQDTSFTALTSYPPAITVKAFGMETFMQVESLSTLMYLNFAASTSSDFSVAFALCYLLHRFRTGFERFVNALNLEDNINLNTGLIAAFDSTASMLSYVFMPHNFIFLAFYLLLGKLGLVRIDFSSYECV